MKKINFYFILLLGLGMALYPATISKDNSTMEMVNHIHWLGQAAVRIDAPEITIFIDPYQIDGKIKADLILITHSHGDHFSPADINKIMTANTLVIAPKDCISRMKDLNREKALISEPGMKKQIGEILIEAVPAYNVVKTNFHAKANQWVGYILTIDGVRIYHAGDTERIPEMKDIQCDIAMLPLGQTYTMNSVQEAAEAALDVKAIVAIPIHYGLYEGTHQDAVLFQNLLKGKIKVILKNKE
jgi:L-ascorbate metabolism protein UlaG (beta-lactamase superfamily)